MSQLRISTRLMVLIGLMAVLLVGIGGFGLSGISQSNDALRSMYEDRTVCVGQLDVVVRRLLDNRIELLRALLNPTSEAVARGTGTVDKNLKVLEKTWGKYTATYLTDKEKVLAEKCTDARNIMVKEGILPAVAALRANDTKEAQRILVDKMPALYKPVGDGVDALIELQLTEARKEFDAATAR